MKCVTDCENRAQRENETKLFGNGMVVLGLATSHCRKLTWKMKFEAGTSKGRLPLISLWLLAVFVGTGTSHTCAPCYKSGRSFTSVQMFHTHTHAPLPRGFLRLRQMRWRWKWKENGNEMTMKMRWQLLNRNTRGGTQKRKGKREYTNTNTPSPKRANPERAREKKKRTDDGPNANQRRGGGQKRLTQPTRREPKPTPAREGPKPDLEREHAWDRGPLGS